MSLHNTSSPAFLMLEQNRMYTPLLYPFFTTIDDKPYINPKLLIRSCANRSNRFSFKCALKWLAQEDLRVRRLFAQRGGDWTIRLPSPDLDLSGPLAQLPDDRFEDYTGE